MVDLSRAVEDLVAAALSEAAPRALRPVVERVLDGFERSAKGPRDAALRSLGRALRNAEGKSAQILCLALGALVEGGASPELAWPDIARDLRELLDGATDFATAAVKQAKEHHLDAAIEAVGAKLAKKKPHQAAAWNALPSRCLAAVACLTRSKELRARARKNSALKEAAGPLSSVVAEVGYLLQALSVVDDATVLVLAPEAGRGWRVGVDALASNAELYVLLGDALLGDPKKGRLGGKRPYAKIVAALREGVTPKRGPASIRLPFQLLTWTAVDEDGSLPPASEEEADHWIWAEGLTGEIPLFGKERIVLLQANADPRPTLAAPSFEGLRPELRIETELSPTVVARTLQKLAKAKTKGKPSRPKARGRARASRARART